MARAQQPERMRRIGVLMTTDDAEGQARMRAFLQGLQHLGWVDGRNVRIEARWTVGKADNVRRYVAELAALAPDVIVAIGSASVGLLLQTTHAIPIVFAQVVDPVGDGFVERVWRGRVGMRPDLPNTSMASARSGLNYSRRSRPA